MAVVPPPLTGMTVVSAHVLEELRARFAVRTWVVTRRPPDGNTRWRLRKHLHLLVGVLLLPVFRATRHRTLYATAESGLGLATTAAQALVARVLRYTVLLHHHAYAPINDPSHLMRIVVWLGGPHLHHILLSCRMEADFRRQYPKARHTHVVGNAFVLLAHRSHSESHRERGEFTVGMLANLTAEKGVEALPRIADALESLSWPANLIVAGPTLDDVARREIEALAKRTTVEYIGPVAGVDKDRFFSRLDCFVLPTEYRNEAQPLVVFEALASGVPVVATDRGSIREQVGAGGWAEPDVDTVIARVIDLASQPSELQRARSAIPHLIHEAVARYEDELEQVMDLVP